MRERVFKDNCNTNSYDKGIYVYEVRNLDPRRLRDSTLRDSELGDSELSDSARLQEAHKDFCEDAA
jgi:hypothetical protein